MGYFPVRYDSGVVIYELKMFIRLATGKMLLAPSAFGDLYSRCNIELKHWTET